MKIKKKKKKLKPAAKLNPEVMKLYGKLDYKYGDLVTAKLSKYVTIKGKILARANFPDILTWFIVKGRGKHLQNNVIVVSHDKLTIRKKKVKYDHG